MTQNLLRTIWWSVAVSALPPLLGWARLAVEGNWSLSGAFFALVPSAVLALIAAFVQWRAEGPQLGAAFLSTSIPLTAGFWLAYLPATLPRTWTWQGVPEMRPDDAYVLAIVILVWFAFAACLNYALAMWRGRW
jgi:hypothetical protein